MRSLAVLCLQSLPLAHGSGLQVSPVTLTLSANQRADTLSVSNASPRLMRVQIRAYAWLQRNGENRYINTQELVVSPPYVQLSPGYRQLIRVVRRPSGATDTPAMISEIINPKEKAYRLIIDELPSLDPSMGSGYVLRYSIPIFLQSDQDAAYAPNLKWKLDRVKDGFMLQVSNSGTQHAQLADAKLTGLNGCTAAVRNGLLGYALPQSTMRWLLTTQPMSTCRPSTLHVKLNGEASQPIRLQDIADSSH